jgi:excisionase family DNA binding protein
MKDDNSVIDILDRTDYHSGIPGSEDVNVSVENKLEKLLTVQDICELLGVPRSYVYRLTHTKRILHLKIRGHMRFRRTHIDEWLKSQEVRGDVGL